MTGRDDVLRSIRDCLDKAGIKYEIFLENPDSVVVRIDMEENGTGPVVQLEESLARDGILFDTGYDVVRRKREWILDMSLERNGMKLTGPAQESKLMRGPATSYRVGDVFRLPLDDRGHFGYGRILFAEPPLILVEFYRIVAERDPLPSAFVNLDWILRIYTGDLGLTQLKTWQVIGNISVPSDFPRPLFWLKDPLNGRLYLFKDPIRQAGGVETTIEEVRRLRAQPGLIFGHEMAKGRLIRELRETRLL